MLRHDDDYNPIIDMRSEKNPVWVTIERGDKPVTDAKVVVAGVEIPFEPDIFKKYYSELPGTPFVPGQDVAIEITVGSDKVTETVKMPGGITISEDGASVSWLHEGNSDHLYVVAVDERGYPDSVSTYATYEGKNCEKASDLVSPYSVGVAAYPSAGEHLLTMVVREKKSNAFSGLPGLKSGAIEAVDLKSSQILK
ncbi:MAG: hypothetical protein ACOX6T_06175 [Myxococcales bacterium]